MVINQLNKTMKKLTIILLIALSVGCKQKTEPIKYPKYVHNSCTGKWAILTGFGLANHFHGIRYLPGVNQGEPPKEENLYLAVFPHQPSIFIAIDDTLGRREPQNDTVFNAPIGQEQMFDDSVSAAALYNGWIKNKQAADMAERARQMDEANLSRKKQLIADSMIVFAWGAFKEAHERAAKVAAHFPGAYCLGKNLGGHPKHPLYLAGNTKPILFK